MSRIPHSNRVGLSPSRTGTSRASRSSSGRAARISLGESAPGFCSGLHRAVVVGLGCGERAPQLCEQDALNEEILFEYPPLHRTAAHDHAERPISHRFDRPEHGIAQHDPPHPVRARGDRAQTDGAAPIVSHQNEAVELQVIDQLAEDRGVFGDGVAETRRTFGQSETQVVDGDTPVPVAQVLHDVAVEETPRRSAMTEQDRWSGPLVDVMNSANGRVEPARLERIQIPVGNEVDQHYPLPPMPDYVCGAPERAAASTEMVVCGPEPGVLPHGRGTQWGHTQVDSHECGVPTQSG